MSFHSRQLDFFVALDRPLPKPIVEPSHRTARGKCAYQTGLTAEDTAARLYERRGYRVIARRWRGPRDHGGSDIDLVVSKGPTTVFVEVKARRSLEEAAHSVMPRQWSRLERAAESYMLLHGMGTNADIRFDVVLLDRHGATQIIENAQPF